MSLGKSCRQKRLSDRVLALFCFGKLAVCARSLFVSRESCGIVQLEMSSLSSK